MTLSLAVRKDWPQLHGILNKVIQSVTKAERSRIMSKWGPSRDARKDQDLGAVITFSKEESAFLKTHPGPFKVHNETDWPPYNYNEGGKPRGYSIDFMNLAAQKAGLEVEYISGHNWDEFLNMARNKELDVMLNIAKNECDELF